MYRLCTIAAARISGRQLAPAQDACTVMGDARTSAMHLDHLDSAPALQALVLGVHEALKDQQLGRLEDARLQHLIDLVRNHHVPSEEWRRFALFAEDRRTYSRNLVAASPAFDLIILCWPSAAQRYDRTACT